MRTRVAAIAIVIGLGAGNVLAQDSLLPAPPAPAAPPAQNPLLPRAPRAPVAQRGQETPPLLPAPPAPAARPAQNPPPVPPAAPTPSTRPVNPAAPAPPLPPPAPPRQAPRPDAPAQLVNIRIDLVVTEEGGTGPGVRKTASLLLGDRQGGSVRSFGRRDAAGPQGSPLLGANAASTRLNLDAFPMLQRDGRVQLQVTLEYGAPGTDDTSVRVAPLLESGKPVVVSQSTSPLSDRRVSLELTATVLK